MIVAQVRAVVEDIGVDAVKIGMLGSVASVRAVARALDLLAPGTPIVVDPVMVAESGARLLETGAEDALRELILPRATVVTPNVPEARVLAGDASLDGEALARAVHALGPQAVVVTGGHRDVATDIFFDADQVVEHPRAAPPGRRRARLGLHALRDARRAPRARGDAAGGRAGGQDRRVGGRARRPRELGAGPGPVDVLGLRARAQRERPAGGA